MSEYAFRGIIKTDRYKRAIDFIKIESNEAIEEQNEQGYALMSNPPSHTSQMFILILRDGFEFYDLVDHKRRCIDADKISNYMNILKDASRDLEIIEDDKMILRAGTLEYEVAYLDCEKINLIERNYVVEEIVDSEEVMFSKEEYDAIMNVLRQSDIVFYVKDRKLYVLSMQGVILFEKELQKEHNQLAVRIGSKNEIDMFLKKVKGSFVLYITPHGFIFRYAADWVDAYLYAVSYESYIEDAEEVLAKQGEVIAQFTMSADDIRALYAEMYACGNVLFVFENDSLTLETVDPSHIVAYYYKNDIHTGLNMKLELVYDKKLLSQLKKLLNKEVEVIIEKSEYEDFCYFVIEGNKYNMLTEKSEDYDRSKESIQKFYEKHKDKEINAHIDDYNAYNTAIKFLKDAKGEFYGVEREACVIYLCENDAYLAYHTRDVTSAMKIGYAEWGKEDLVFAGIDFMYKILRSFSYTKSKFRAIDMHIEYNYPLVLKSSGITVLLAPYIFESGEEDEILEAVVEEIGCVNDRAKEILKGEKVEESIIEEINKVIEKYGTALEQYMLNERVKYAKEWMEIKDKYYALLDKIKNEKRRKMLKRMLDRITEMAEEMLEVKEREEAVESALEKLKKSTEREKEEAFRFLSKEELEKMSKEQILEYARKLGEYIRENTAGMAGVREWRGKESLSKVLDALKDLVIAYFGLTNIPEVKIDSKYMFERYKIDGEEIPPNRIQREFNLSGFVDWLYHVAANGWDLAESLQEWRLAKKSEHIKEIERCKVLEFKCAIGRIVAGEVITSRGDFKIRKDVNEFLNEIEQGKITIDGKECYIDWIKELHYSIRDVLNMLENLGIKHIIIEARYDSTRNYAYIQYKGTVAGLMVIVEDRVKERGLSSYVKYTIKRAGEILETKEYTMPIPTLEQLKSDIEESISKARIEEIPPPVETGTEILEGYTIPKFPTEYIKRSYSGISMTPEKRGEMEEREYLNYIRRIIKEGEKAGLSKEDIQKLIDMFANKYIKLSEEAARTRAQLMSPMIVGPSGFPAARMKKIAESLDKKELALIKFVKEFFNRTLPKYIQSKRVEEAGGEVAYLEKELEEWKKALEIMKEANKIVRSKKLTQEEKERKLREIGAYKVESLGYRLYFPEPDYMGRLGFPYYELDSVRNKIKRIEENIKKAKEKEEKKGKVEVSANYPQYGFKIVKDYSKDRVMIYFTKTPPEDLRTQLKKHGFRWSPHWKAWVRKLTPNAVYDAREILFKYYGIQEHIGEEAERIIKKVEEEAKKASIEMKKKLKEKREQRTIEYIKYMINEYKKNLKMLKGDYLRDAGEFYVKEVYPELIQELKEITDRQLAEELKKECEELYVSFKRYLPEAERKDNEKKEEILVEKNKIIHLRAYLDKTAELEAKLDNGERIRGDMDISTFIDELRRRELIISGKQCIFDINLFYDPADVVSSLLNIYPENRMHLEADWKVGEFVDSGIYRLEHQFFIAGDIFKIVTEIEDVKHKRKLSENKGYVRVVIKGKNMVEKQLYEVNIPPWADIVNLIEKTIKEFVERLERKYSKVSEGEFEIGRLRGKKFAEQLPLRELEREIQSYKPKNEYERGYLRGMMEVYEERAKEIPEEEIKREKIREELERFAVETLRDMTYGKEAENTVKNKDIQEIIDTYTDEVLAGLPIDEAKTELKEWLNVNYAKVPHVSLRAPPIKVERVPQIPELPELPPLEEDWEKAFKILPDILLFGLPEAIEITKTPIHPANEYEIENRLIEYIRRKGKEALKSDTLREQWAGIVMYYAPKTIVKKGVRKAVKGVWDEIVKDIRNYGLERYFSGVDYTTMSRMISYWVMKLLGIPESEIPKEYIEANEKIERRLRA